MTTTRVARRIRPNDVLTSGEVVDTIKEVGSRVWLRVTNPQTQKSRSVDWAKYAEIQMQKVNRDPKLQLLIDGGQAIVDDRWLDDQWDEPEAIQIKTCINRHRVGTLDRYVAWISNPPADLERLTDFTCTGSINE